ncbi:MAG: hypothetical protein HXX10_02705 [Rhodoplanes sp.]|uniref:hypothetical protein n=1 Tax=Rhodoplanes sp. TaxID=1968906 RepID=UPI0017E71A57|nr:hypothetical protein [Rhodoplanes sp.]NVO12925.1 hypothetical protein [Rhodoplanes sp.]
MRIIYALAVVVLTLVVLNKMPYPGAKQVVMAPPSPVAVAVAATPAPAKAAEAPAPAVVAKPEPPRVQYVSSRQCVRSAFGAINCTELTTVVR